MNAGDRVQNTSSQGAHRRILLVDADAFFVAVARQVDPEGAGRTPLLIVGGNPGSRGVVCSASYECRAFGVRSAMPIARALKLCPDAMCVPVPREACRSQSRKIQGILEQFSPVVQPSSIDEWYCDMAGTEALYQHEAIEATAARIRDAVMEATSLRVSVGGGTSRLIAKLAVESAKPGAGGTGVFCVPPGAEESFMLRFRLADLPMVGPKFTARLRSIGLESVTDARAWSRDQLVRQLGNRAGSWLFDRVRGIDRTAVMPDEPRKQISRETTFSVFLEDPLIIRRELLRLAVRVSFDLRRQALHARTVTIKIRNSRFETRTAQRTVAEPIESEHSVAAIAQGLLRQVSPAPGEQVRLLGVALSHFDGLEEPTCQSRLSEVQLSLFSDSGNADTAFPSGRGPCTDSAPFTESGRERALSHAMDRIRAKFGTHSIQRAQLADTRDETGPRVEE